MHVCPPDSILEVGIPVLTTSTAYLQANASSAFLTLTGANLTAATASIEVYLYDNTSKWIDWLSVTVISSSAAEISVSISSSLSTWYVPSPVLQSVVDY